jgi:hypothetical protein
MMAYAEPLSEIDLSASFRIEHICADTSRQAFSQSPASWRRERENPGEVTSKTA